MVHDYSFFGSTADFVIKKEHLGFLPVLAIYKRRRRRVENMTVELDSRHPLLPKAGWGKWRFDSDLKKKLEDQPTEPVSLTWQWNDTEANFKGR